MRYQEVAPPPPLDALIHCFWFLEGQADEPSPQTIVPDGRTEIVLHLGDPFAAVGADGIARPQARALFAGQLTGPFHLVPGRSADVVGIRFHPAAGRALIGVPLHEMSDEVVPLELVAPGLAGALAGALASARDASARVAALTGVLIRVVRSEPSALVGAAVRLLGSARPLRIKSLGATLGVTPRTLERRVREEVGLSPALLRSVLRFQRVFRRLERAPAGSWAGVAASAGYFDQAHLIRDFRRFAGAPPSAFLGGDSDLSRAFLGADEAAGDRVAFIQSGGTSVEPG